MNLAIQLTKNQEQRLAEMANRLNISASSLAEAVVRDMVNQPESDFERVSKRLLEKNRDLYERLR